MGIVTTIAGRAALAFPRGPVTVPLSVHDGQGDSRSRSGGPYLPVCEPTQWPRCCLYPSGRAVSKRTNELFRLLGQSDRDVKTRDRLPERQRDLVGDANVGAYLIRG